MPNLAACMQCSASSVTVIMFASQASDPGSTPGWRTDIFYFFPYKGHNFPLFSLTLADKIEINLI